MTGARSPQPARGRRRCSPASRSGWSSAAGRSWRRAGSPVRADRRARLDQESRGPDGHVLSRGLGYIRELEEAAGFRFLERKPGGGGTGGAFLTSEGRAFLVRYRRFRKTLDRMVSRRFTRAFQEELP